MSLLFAKFAATLLETAHRPFPLAAGPWVMKQTWSNLLFAHWCVPLESMRKILPPCFEMDLFEGRAYIGVVPFLMEDVSPRYCPNMPWLSTFPELNVRTYVRYKDQPGVYFFSLDAGNPVAVWVARTAYHLPYFNAEMRIEQGADGYFHYQSLRKEASEKIAAPCLRARYKAVGPVWKSVPGSLDHFLTERYCLFTTHGSRVYRGDIHHKPWPLQDAVADFQVNTMTAPLGLELSGEPLLHFVEGIETVEWPIQAC